MDSDRAQQILGMALLRGLVDGANLKSVLASGDDPLEALVARGVLDEEDLRDLGQLVDAQRLEPTSMGEPCDLPTLEGLPGSGRGLWDSVPRNSGEASDTGRQVLKILKLSSWKQYRNLRFVAEGGMGRVFKAFDPSLNRTVALKFLRRDGVESQTRFLLEAQNQAMVEHPNICKVFEVGEWEGQCYIAMQFLRGETLDLALTRLGLEDKVKVMEAVAEAVHAAHRQGLIHRDLKPANIMVEEAERGPKPTILDFGLAKGLEETGLTVQGQVIGTAHYMAPEQARGDHARVGRCTDIYGLGATLHKVLTGQAPFAETGGVDAVRRALEEDVPSLRRMVSDLPEDLDTITRKCLEKDPARRYENALAVAEDLRRWREGEPILACKPTLRYRAGKWARRHKLVVAVGALGLAGVCFFAGLGWWTQRTALARARWAQSFGQEAERIESLLRYSQLLPPHDARPERAQARARMEALERQAHVVGRVAAAPSAYALGRSHLALGDPEKAKVLLEQAWSGGLRTPEVALALGRALAAAYQRGLDSARALPSKELREAREKELALELREPALARLREGAPAALESPAYHEALVAVMEGRWDEALAKARSALAATPWLFEAKRLEGEVLLERAKAERDSTVALALFGEAERCLIEAGGLAPSDPAIPLARARLLGDRIVREMGAGGHPDAILVRTREATALAERLDSDGGEAKAQLAKVLSMSVQYVSNAAAASAHQEALELSRQALAREPDNPAVLSIRIPVLLSYGLSLVEKKNGDPSAWYLEAQALARQAQRRHPADPVLPLRVMQASKRRMIWEMRRGVSPWSAFEEALAQAQALRARFPDVVSLYGDLASLWIERAEFERTHGLDPRPSVSSALEALATAKAKGLVTKTGDWNEGDAHLVRGEHLSAVAGEGEADLWRAAEAFRRTREANPNLGFAAHSEAAALFGVAKERLESGRDPGPALEEAWTALNRKEAKRSNEPAFAHRVQGWLHLLEGRRALAAGQRPEPHWSQAEDAFRQSLAARNSTGSLGGLAEVNAHRYLAAGRKVDRDASLAAARQALEMDPLFAEGWFWIAVTEQEAARRGDTEAARRAREAWAKALDLNRNLERQAKRFGKP